MYLSIAKNEIDDKYICLFDQNLGKKYMYIHLFY